MNNKSNIQISSYYYNSNYQNKGWLFNHPTTERMLKMNADKILKSFALKRKIYKTLILLGLTYNPEENHYSPTEDFLLGNSMESNILDDVTFRKIGDCYVVTINTFGGISDATSDTYPIKSEEDLIKVKGFIEAALQGFEPPVLEGGVI